MSVSSKFRISKLNPSFSQALLIASPALDISYPILEPVHSSLYRYHEVVQQVDLVPTLSVLFDLGIPKYARFLSFDYFSQTTLINTCVGTRWVDWSIPLFRDFVHLVSFSTCSKIASTYALGLAALDRGFSANVEQMTGVLEAAGVNVDQLLCQAKTKRGQTCEESKLLVDSNTASLVSSISLNVLRLREG